MVATPIQTEERPTAQSSTIDQLESLVPAAVRLTQLHERGALSEQEFEAGLGNLFRKARTAQASLGTDYIRVYLDFSKDPIKVEPADSPKRYDPLYVRIDQMLQPYFAYAWEYSGGSAQRAVRFDEQETDAAQREAAGLAAVKGAWVDLVR